MAEKFAATMLTRTEGSGSSALAITLADGNGRTRTLTLTPDLALTLADVLATFGAMGAPSPLQATKRPRSFAVGSGKYENVVLLRFEDDAPYALPAMSALELAKALLEQSEEVALRPEAHLQ
jgi:hypothetical protein